MTMDLELERLRRRTTSFAEFVRATKRDWSRLASYLYRQWPLPAGVGLEDVEQELTFSAWRNVEAWDATKGMSLSGYVVWCACTDAKKWLHGQRNSLRRRASSPGRFELPASAFVREGEEGPRAALPEPSCEPTQHAEAERRESYEALRRELPWVEATTLHAIVECNGDLARATRVVYQDPKLRLRARLGSRKDARRLVGRVVSGVLEQVDGGEPSERRS